MKVSIITIVYNNKACIADCLKSVLSQSYSNIEHIVIDGGSNDGTQKEIEAFQKGLAYYISEKDEGPYSALNKGIGQASGDVIGILHSDDVFFGSNTIEKVVGAFQQSDADLVYANGMYVDKKDPQKIIRIYPAKAFRKYYLSFGWIPLHTTIFVKKELFQHHGLYDQQFSIASDYDMSLRWFNQPDIKKYFLNEWVVKMRFGGISTSAHLQKKKSTEDLIIIRRHQLWGWFTLACKIARKIPQYIIPHIVNIK